MFKTVNFVQVQSATDKKYIEKCTIKNEQYINSCEMLLHLLLLAMINT